MIADDGVRLVRPLPVVTDGLPESADGAGGVKREEGVSDCGARDGEVGEGRTVEPVRRQNRVWYMLVSN